MIVNKKDFMISLSEEERNNGYIKFNMQDEDDLTRIDEGIWGWITEEDKEKYNDDNFFGTITAILCNDPLNFSDRLSYGSEVVLRCNGSDRPTLDIDWIYENLVPEILVLSRQRAVKYSRKEHPEQSIVISITDCSRGFPSIHKGDSANIRAILKLKFDDVTEDNNEYTAISMKQANKIVEFIKNYPDIDRIIVHCEAGVSRSAGCAAAILKYLKNDDSQIFDDKYYKPNMTVYHKVLNAFMETA